MVLKTTRVKNVKFKIIEIRTGCQNIGYCYHSNNLNRAAQNLRLGPCVPRAGDSWSIVEYEPPSIESVWLDCPMHSPVCKFESC